MSIPIGKPELYEYVQREKKTGAAYHIDKHHKQHV